MEYIEGEECLLTKPVGKHPSPALPSGQRCERSCSPDTQGSPVAHAPDTIVLWPSQIHIGDSVMERGRSLNLVATKVHLLEVADRHFSGDWLPSQRRCSRCGHY